MQSGTAYIDTQDRQLRTCGSVSRILLLLAIACCATAQSRSSETAALGPLLPPMPDAFSPVTLRAVNDPRTGLASFSFEGREIPPVLHGRRQRSSGRLRECNVGSLYGDVRGWALHQHDQSSLPRSARFTGGASGRCALDDGFSRREPVHEVQIPADQPPGLYWYHTHPHGESYQQSLDGMSGALIVDGIERYAPEVRSMRQQILVLRDAVLKPDDAASIAERTRAQASNAACGSEPEGLKRLFTVNRILRPAIAIRPGEKQFWRIVNASPDLYADLQVTGESMRVIALDGMPLSFHDPRRHVEVMTHVLLPPAGRVEAIVTGPRRGTRATLSSRCVSTGPDGDPNPAMVLADLTDELGAATTPRLHMAPGLPVYRPITSSKLAALKQSRSDFSVIFTEDKHGFYINGKKYEPNALPMIAVPVGAYHHWSVVNRSREVHPFHIHQVHFQVYAKDGVPLHPAEWLDTINVEPGDTVDMIMDFTDPIIRGVSLFHCHLLQHEDKGMMAKILFTDPTPVD